MSPYKTPSYGFTGSELPPEIYELASPTLLSHQEREFACEVVAATLQSLNCMVDPGTGLPCDTLYIDGTRKPETSPSNLGLYLATLGQAARLGLLPRDIAGGRAATLLQTTARIDTVRGKLPAWIHAGTLEVVDNRISSVDNAWFTLGLIRTTQTFPGHAGELAGRQLAAMNLEDMYDPERHLFYGIASRGQADTDTELVPEGWHYGHLGTEAKFMSWLRHEHFGKPDDNALELMARAGHLTDIRSYGGSMFEVLLGAVAAPESLGTREREQVARYVERHIKIGRLITGSLWGHSPCLAPVFNYAQKAYTYQYREYGVGALATDPATAYTKSGSFVVTPHAVALAAEFAPHEALETLAAMKHRYPKLYHDRTGFADAVDLKTGEVTPAHLALDQSMVALGLMRALSEMDVSKKSSIPHAA